MFSARTSHFLSFVTAQEERLSLTDLLRVPMVSLGHGAVLLEGGEEQRVHLRFEAVKREGGPGVHKVLCGSGRDGCWRYNRVSRQLLAPARAPGPRPALEGQLSSAKI